MSTPFCLRLADLYALLVSNQKCSAYAANFTPFILPVFHYLIFPRKKYQIFRRCKTLNSISKCFFRTVKCPSDKSINLDLILIIKLVFSSDPDLQQHLCVFVLHGVFRWPPSKPTAQIKGKGRGRRVWLLLNELAAEEESDGGRGRESKQQMAQTCCRYSQ